MTTTISLLSATLGLAAPWEITDARFSETENRVDMVIEFSGGSTFPCPTCGMSATICSVNHETWHHPTFFRFSAYLHARIPSVECCRCGTHRIPPTWIPASSGFVPFSGDHSA